MAQQYNNNSSAKGASFDGNSSKDTDAFHNKPNQWVQARNASNNTTVGDLGSLSNEQSNRLAAIAPYTIIGAIHIINDEWAVFSTDDLDSEIGIFKEDAESYETLVNDRKLNFNKDYLVIGIGKTFADCGERIYWDDGLNPTRYMDVRDVPWVQDCSVVDSCEICVDQIPLTIDENKIRLAPLVKNICLSLESGNSGGELFNGTYIALAAYTINGIKVTDYSLPSNAQSLFDHLNLSGSLIVNVDFADQGVYETFQLVIVQLTNKNPVYKIVGDYSVKQKVIAIDSLFEELPSVNSQDELVIQNAIVEKSEGIYRNGEYALRIAPTNKLDFNYQPLANQIEASWVYVEYPADYYREGGNKVSYMKDESYAFFVRWVWDTGDKSASYHIPGRSPENSDLTRLVGSEDVLEDDGDNNETFRIYNTASIDFNHPLKGTVLEDGGLVVSAGKMGYMESSEIYDDDNPLVWNATYTDPETGVNIGGTSNTKYDLCGKNIRHHRFPEEGTDLNGQGLLSSYRKDGDSGYIRIMGVDFSNIKPPVDNSGQPIANIVGYEIYRASREGNKTILAKGVLNNMRKYESPANDGIDDDLKLKYLYPNYPYNNLEADEFLSTTDTQQGGGDQVWGVDSLTTAPIYDSSNVSREAYTFHSPDTNFRNPFLSGKEVKVYSELKGSMFIRNFYPTKHPKVKLLKNNALVMALIGGIAYLFTKTEGNKKLKYTSPRLQGANFNGTVGTPLSFLGGSIPISPDGALFITAAGVGSLLDTILEEIINEFGGNYSLGSLLTNTTIGDYNRRRFQILNNKNIATAIGPTGTRDSGYQTEEADISELDKTNSALAALLSTAAAASGTSNLGAGKTESVIKWFTEGVNAALELIYAFIPYRQYALQQTSHCFYDEETPRVVLNNGADAGNTRRGIDLRSYLNPEIRELSGYSINNIYRSRTVFLTLDLTRNGNSIDAFTLPTSPGSEHLLAKNYIGPNKKNWSRQSIISKPVTNRKSVTQYVALKQRLINQYGQIRGLRQLPILSCMIDKGKSSTGVLFGGDVYIGRYTEKNTMFFFYNWMDEEPDGTEWDYKKYNMITYPKFWMNTEPFDFNEFISSWTEIFSPGDGTPPFPLPRSKYCLDKNDENEVFEFGLDNGFMYLFNSGVKDFYVESEINLALRDWGDAVEERHYDYIDYTNIRDMFKSDIIKVGNFYKYDFSLSVTNAFTNWTSFSFMQAPGYDPKVAASCYKYTPRRIIYSLPQNDSLVDFWKIFLPLNYKDFTAEPTVVKPIGKTGSLVLFKNESPILIPSSEQLSLDGGTKLTVGDGGLFSQPSQTVANAEFPYEYGSSQNKYSIVNTPAGLFYISQNQGKIFRMGQGLEEISNKGYKWWFAKYLPYKLTEQFPDFELTDNPVVGIGCQTVFDNENQILYFSKKDYVLKENLGVIVTYIGGRKFLVNEELEIDLGDDRYFAPASWTASFDPKIDGWISFHDWFPDLVLPSKNTFMTIKEDSIWIHNDRCNSFCNFYGQDYPFEIEYEIDTQAQVTTLRNLTYFMEAYKYGSNCYDRFHDLDFNFDEAIIWNSEQCSGLLKLNNTPKNNAPLRLTYPRINFDSIDIIYDKEEQKYRFNQFWDITDNRGEFDPSAERTLFITAPNGFVKDLNPNNLNYNKFALERKKFRHYKTRVILRKTVSGDRNIIVSTTIDYTLNSFR